MNKEKELLKPSYKDFYFLQGTLPVYFKDKCVDNVIDTAGVVFSDEPNLVYNTDGVVIAGITRGTKELAVITDMLARTVIAEKYDHDKITPNVQGLSVLLNKESKVIAFAGPESMDTWVSIK